MSRLHNDSGGYLGARPSQNTSSHPGVFSEASRSRDRAENNWVSGTEYGTIPGPSTAPPDGGPTGIASTNTYGLGRSGAVGNNGTNIVVGADDTVINVKTDANGYTYLTVTNAAATPGSGGTATEERRTLYYYYYNGGYSTAYSGNQWPYVYVQGILQKDSSVSATTTIETMDGRLKINGYYVYQYTSETDNDSVAGIQSNWHAISANGNGNSTNVTGSVTNTTTTGNTRSEYQYALTDGTTSGTNWSISGTNLSLTIPANTIPSTYLGVYRIRIPAEAFRTTDGFVSSDQVDFYYYPGVLGASATAAVGSAKALLQQDSTATSGIYYIKNVNGQSNSSSNARQLYCDMSTDGGGWTRFFNVDMGSTGSSTYSVQYSNQEYNVGSLTGSNLDSLHYCTKNHLAHRRQYSTGNYHSYLFEINGGTYKFKMDSYYEGDPGVNNRNASGIAGYSNSHFDFGWFNSNNNGYWNGINGTTSASCASGTNVVHQVQGNSTHSGGYFGLSRGYHATPGGGGSCTDHCGNNRLTWTIFPYNGFNSRCYNGHNSNSGVSGGGRISVYYRERGTISSAGL